MFAREKDSRREEGTRIYEHVNFPQQYNIKLE